MPTVPSAGRWDLTSRSRRPTCARFNESVASASVARAADLARERGEGDVVAGEAGAAVAQGPAQVLLPDPGVEPQRGRHDVHVGPGSFSQTCASMLA